MDVPMKTYWMGEDIDGLPREKLIEIIGHLARQIDQQHKTTRSIIEIHQLANARRAAFT